jgi:hypothetical protein
VNIKTAFSLGKIDFTILPIVLKFTQFSIFIIFEKSELELDGAACNDERINHASNDSKRCCNSVFSLVYFNP